MWIKFTKYKNQYIPNTPEVMLFEATIAYGSASSNFCRKKVKKKITFILLISL